MRRLVFALVILSFALGLFPAHAAEKDSGGPNDQMQSKGATTSGGNGAPADDKGPIYVNIAPFVLPVLGDNGPEQLITLVITLEVDSKDKAELIKDRLPRLNDAYLQTLYGAIDKKMITKGQLVDLSLVKVRLQSPTQRVLGLGVVNDILVQAVSQRKI